MYEADNEKMEARLWEMVNAMRKENQEAIENSTADFGEEYKIPTRAGDGKVLIYSGEQGAPVFFNIHGGGFVAGYAENDAEFCDRLHQELGIWVINMEYRLAPEYLCPADKEDIYDMLVYLWEHEKEFPFDRNRMLIGGHSAGGNIATTVCRMLKEQRKFSFIAQVLNCPPLDFATMPEDKYFAEGAVEPEAVRIFTVSYCRDKIGLKDERISPYWLPVEALVGMPDALIITAENDSLRDEGEEYAKKLMQAGAEVTGKRFPGRRHVFAASDTDGQEYMIRYIERKIAEHSKNFHVTKDSTLQEVLCAARLESREYMVSPMEYLNTSFFPDPDIRKKLDTIIRGRKFKELTLEEIIGIFTAWNLQSMAGGLEFLAERAQKETIVYDIWKDRDGGKSGTGLFAFPAKRGQRKFVVICPGGAYENVCSVAEGFPVAKALHDLGYASFVLQYRTGKYAGQPNPLDDLAQAVKFIQEHAEEFGVEKGQYAVVGFSAGGHLAASFGTESTGYRRYGLPKPEMLILGYPVITMGEKTHEGSRTNLLGALCTDEQMQELYSVEKQVSAEYPKTYIWQTEEDEAVPIENSRMMAEALREQGVPSRYEVFPGKDHGWGLGTGTAAEGWLERAVRFWEENDGSEH